jgi:hypothetical protein
MRINTILSTLHGYVRFDINFLRPHIWHIIVRGSFLLSTFGILVTSLVVAQPPIAYWPFTGNANDVSGNGHNGAVFGALLTSDRFGNLNSAYKFDGINSNIMVPDAPDLRFPGKKFSISYWMKTCAAQGNYVSIMSKGQFTQSEYSITIVNGILHYFIGLRLEDQSRPGVVIITGTWRHVVITYDSNSAIIPRLTDVWVDGQYVTNYPSGFPLILDATNTQPLYFAMGSVFGPPAIPNFNGALDDIRFYDRVLSPTEIQALYTENGWPVSPSFDVTSSINGPTTICPGDSVQIEARTVGAVATFAWIDAAGGSRPNGMNPGDEFKKIVTVRPTRTTTYRAVIASSEPCPEYHDTSDVTIVVRDGPQFQRTPPRYICPGDTVNIGGPASGGTLPHTYRWDPKPGLVNLAQITQRVAPLVSTDYYLNVTDANGCKARDTTRIIILGQPILAGLQRQVDICRGTRDSIGVEATGGSGRFRYKWIPALGLSSDTVARPEANPAATTRYIVTVTDIALGCIRTDSVAVIIHERPIADAGSDITLCRDSSTIIGAITGVSGVRYAWSPALGLNDSTLAQPTARPTTTTTYHLIAIDTLTGCESSDDITVNILDGTISPATTTLDFGELDGCTSSREMAVELANTGNTDITITTADISAAAYSIVSPSLPIVLKPGAKLSLVVRFAPGVAGLSSGEVTLHGSPCGVATVIDLRGSKLESLVAVHPSNIDFGTSLACESIQRDTVIIIVNNGTAPVNVGTPGIVAPYSIIAPAFPSIIQPGDTLRVQLRYTPTRGIHASDLRLPYQSGTCRDTLRIKLDGLHELPSLASDPTSIDIGLLAGCTTSRDTTITLQNSGLLPLTIDSTQLPAGWRIVNSGSSTLAPGARTTLTLRYEPTGNGPTSGKLRFVINPCAQELIIDLRGTKQGPSFALPDTIDFGDVIFCSDSTVSRTFTLTYSGDTATSATVPSVLLVPLVPSVPSTFTTNLTPGTTLQPGTPATFTINFAPTTDGPSSAELQLHLEPCAVDRTIYLRGNRTTPRLTATPTPLDFGTITVGTTATRQLSYINSGTVPIVIGSVDGLLLPFGLVATTPTLPAPLQPGDTLFVTVSYRGEAGTSQTIAQAVTTTPCTLVTDAQIIGRGSISQEAVLHLPTITGAPGDRVRLPISLERGGSDLDRIGARNFEGVLAFNKTMLIGTDRSNESSDTITRRIRFNGTRRDTSGIIAEIELLVALGNAEVTPLRIESFRWLDGSDTVTTRSDTGEFRLDGICRIGGSRLVNNDGEVVLRPVRPSRGNDIIEIEYALSEDGQTTLEIVDMQGRIVQTLVNGAVHAGRYTATTYVGSLGSGRYLVVLRTPTLVATRDMEVVR